MDGFVKCTAHTRSGKNIFFFFRLLQAIAAQRLPNIQQDSILLYDTVVIGYYVLKAFYFKLLMLLVIMYAKNISNKFTSEMHILSQEKYCLWTRIWLQCIALRGYHAFNKKICYCMVQL